MSATIISLPERPTGRGVKRSTGTRHRRAEIAAAILPAAGTVREFDDDLLPKGMGPRQHNRVFRLILEGEPERQAYLDAMNRGVMARKELKAALAVQHRLLYAVMWRCFPDMARRVSASTAGRRDRP
jgi:hypothetical protein